MSDRPILFSGPMVCALLEGRKTQTRRVLKPEPYEYIGRWWIIDSVSGDCHLDDWVAGRSGSGPRYVVGDRLWVREAWQGLSFGDYLPTKSRVCDLRYRATDPLGEIDKSVRGYPWRPGIHMPRWASRLTLTVTDVRVERLQDISGHDAVAEGACEFAVTPPYPEDLDEARVHFSTLWNSINGPGAWGANPWVAAVTFTVHKANIDNMEAA